MTDDESVGTVPRKGNVLDLDALEAQRRVGRGTALEVKLRGETYLLPIEMPMEAVDALAVMADVDDVDDETDPQAAAQSLRQVSLALDQGLAVMFCTCDELPQEPRDYDDQDGARRWSIADTRVHEHDDCQWPKFNRARPSLETRMALVESVWAAYGVGLGEALRPERPQPSTGGRSGRTSRGSTGATRTTSGGGVKAPADRQRKTPAKKAAAKKAPAKRAASRPAAGGK